MDEVWLFAVVTSDEGILVIFTPENYWRDHHVAYDAHVSHELEAFLPDYFDDEIVEGTFLIPWTNLTMTAERVVNDLLRGQDLTSIRWGFKQDPEFDAFIASVSNLELAGYPSIETPIEPVQAPTSRWERLLNDDNDPFKED